MNNSNQKYFNIVITQTKQNKMDLSEMIMRVLYIVVLFVVIGAIFNSTTPLRGNALLATSFFVAALVFYVSFGRVYEFLLGNELVLKLKQTEEETREEEESAPAEEKKAKRSHKEVHNELNVSNKTNHKNDSKVNHRHTYIEDNVFA